MKTENRAEDQARAQFESIERMVNALDLDWDRLEELRILKADAEECGNDAGHGDDDPVISGQELDELSELEALAGEWQDREDVEQAIQEDPLSVQVRSGWASPGDALNPEEFEILLCTGGPAVRIRGELDEYAQPCRAWMEYQDWGTPWTQFHGASQDILLAYAGQFFYGE